MARETGPATAAEWDAYNALPEWEVTARLARTAVFRVHAATADDAAAALAEGRDGVRSVDDLYDPGGLELTAVISTRPAS